MKATIYLLAFLAALSAVFPQIPVNHSVTSTKGNIELTITNNGIVYYNPVTKKSGFILPRLKRTVLIWRWVYITS